MPFAPKRRWFRFSLRTLFVVVTVFSVWLGYQVNWIRQRHDGLEWLNAHGVGGAIAFIREPRPTLPWSLRPFGEQPLEMHWIGPLDFELVDEPSYRRQVAKMARLFPECQIVDTAPDGLWPISRAEAEHQEQLQFEAAVERYNARRNASMRAPAEPSD